jgi:trimeric autotransporter adhesin
VAYYKGVAESNTTAKGTVIGPSTPTTVSADVLSGNPLGLTSTTGDHAMDTLRGGAGADTYALFYNSSTYAQDDVDESTVADTAIDTVKMIGSSTTSARPNYTLTTNIENFEFSKVATIPLIGNPTFSRVENNQFAFDVTGNASRNLIYATAGSNVLKGMAGIDTLYAGAGSDTLVGADYDFATNTFTTDGQLDVLNGQAGADTYYVDDTDQVVEAAEDLVRDKIIYVGATFSQVSGASTTTFAINANGNDANNTIRGNNGINQLSGGKGADQASSVLRSVGGL